MKTTSSRKAAFIVVIIFIAFALVFYWLGKDDNTLSVQTDSETQLIVSPELLGSSQIELLLNLEKDLPILATIKKLSPETYQSIDKIITENDPTNEQLARRLFDEVMGNTMKLVLERIPYASDESVVNYTVNMKNYLSILLETDPSGKTCFYSLYPHLRDPASIVPSQKMQTELIKQLNAINHLLVSSEDNMSQPMLSFGQQDAILERINGELTNSYGDKMLILDDVHKARHQKALTCRIMINFYDLALGISDNQQKAAFLRTLFGRVFNIEIIIIGSIRVQ